MSRIPLVSLFCVLAAASTIAQQSVHIPDGDPTKGACNGMPFGIFDSPQHPYYAREIKYQTLITAAQLGSFAPRVIRELGFASCYSGVQEFSSITIKMDQISATRLDATFANNLTTSAITVLDATNYLWHRQKDVWNRIGLEKPFVFSPGKSIVIDIELRGARFLTSTFGPVTENIGGFRRSNGQVPRLYANLWKTQPPATGNLSPYGLKIELSSELSALGRFGKGCPGNGKLLPSLGFSKNSSAKPGNTVNIELAGGVPSFPLVLVLGIGSQNRYPYTPALLSGFKGCNLYVTPHLMVPNLTDSSGAATTPLAIPNTTALLNVAVFAQYFQFEVPPLNLRASNYGRVLIGR